MNKGRRNIGIFAHVDAGKTTLSERILYHAGAVRDAGSVDRGTAHTDRLAVERRRGISVKSTCACYQWQGVSVHLIDTPGHIDFAAEVERALWALDGAVLLVSGAEGVEPQTEAIFSFLKARQVPTILFVNKMDREGADQTRVMAEIRRLLSPLAADYVDDEALMAALAETDDQVLSDYLSGNGYPRERILPLCAAQVRAARMLPVLCGSALRDEGVTALMDAINDLLPEPGGDADGPLSGVVFAVGADDAMGRGAYVRLYSGSLANRAEVPLPPADRLYGIAPLGETRKITQIRSVALDGRGSDLGLLTAGGIAVVYGLGEVRAGQILGDPALAAGRVAAGQMRSPLIAVKVLPETVEEKPALYRALVRMSAEDPLLDVEDVGGAIHIRVMGEIQLEILQEELRDRFSLNVTFGDAEVIYHETICEEAVGYVAYLAPKPCWAVIKFMLTPLPRGSGIRYYSDVPVRQVKARYQHQIEQALPTALAQGMLGWQVDDMEIRLVDGEDHLIHTHPLDFIVATPMALMDGLRRGGTKLLEPVLSIRIRTPEDCVGRIMTEMVKMRGTTLATGAGTRVEEAVLHCEAPVKDSLHFPATLMRITSGRGSMSVALKGYRECPPELRAERARKGVNPLDTAKYILAARNALDGAIF